MKNQPLQARFLLAGFLLVLATVGSSLWSALTFVRLNSTVDQTLQQSQETIDLCAELQSSLEREDDALLLFLSGQKSKAQEELIAERQRGDIGLEKLVSRLKNLNSEEHALVSNLRQEINQYRKAGDELIWGTSPQEGLVAYHRTVNPRLRQAVAGCDALREANFRAMQTAGIQARDEAARGTRLVIGISILTAVMGLTVAVWLARSVLGPIRELTDSVEQIRLGNFERRVQTYSAQELKQLGAGFNRMAEALAEYRRSSLGELLAAKTTLEATLNALPDAVFVFGPKGELTMCNPPARKILGAKGCQTAIELEQIPFPLLDKNDIRDSLSGRCPPPRRMDFQNCFSVKFEDQNRRFLFTVVPVPESVHPPRYRAVVVLNDVTEFVRLDELRSEHIAVASHELKSPLTSLQMNLLMLRESNGTDRNRQRELIDAAVSGCEELALTIEELLDVARIEAGQLRLNRIPIDVRTVLAATKKQMQTRFEDAGVRLEWLIGHDPVLVLGDPVRLGSVFANLLSNALKYSAANQSVRLEVSRQNAQNGLGATVQITVTDQGPGIPEEFRERVFEKFFRVEHHQGTRSKEIRGTGIGLYLCREIIKSHGGTICNQAGENARGTRFVVTLPVKV